MEKPETDPEARLRRAITWWIKHDPIATQEEIKRVAKKFMVHPRSLREAIRQWAEIGAKKKSE